MGPRALAFNPDGHIQSLAGITTIPSVYGMLARADTSAPLQGIQIRVNSVAFSPDARTLASASKTPLDQTVRLWDVGTGANTSTPSQGIQTAVNQPMHLVWMAHTLASAEYCTTTLSIYGMQAAR